MIAVKTKVKVKRSSVERIMADSALARVGRMAPHAVSAHVLTIQPLNYREAMVTVRWFAEVPCFPDRR